MGLPLCQRPNGSVTDPMLDDAQFVHESKRFQQHQPPNGSVSDPPLDDAQVVREPNGLPLHQRPNGSDDTQVVHESNGSSLPQRPISGSVSGPLLGVTQLVHEPEERDPHAVPTFTAESLTKPRSIILYLPPLLSSLPQDISVSPISVVRPPLVTETRLPNIDPASLSLHKALHHFGPLSEDYASLPYTEAFNWSDLELPEDEEREWYCVVFRSRRKKGSDSGRKFVRTPNRDVAHYGYSALRCRQTST